MMKYFFTAFLFLFFGCNDSKKENNEIIPPDKMKLVFWDYLRANEYATEIIKKDTSLNDTLINIQLQNLIFNHYKISKETFYKSYLHYTSNTKLLTPILDSIISKHENTRFEYNPASFLKD